MYGDVRLYLMYPRKLTARFPRPHTKLSLLKHTTAQKCVHRSCERHCGHRRRKCPRLINSQLPVGEGEGIFFLESFFGWSIKNLANEKQV